ncbi:MAG: hypothetical protein ACK4HG_18275 [Agrobacterium albertimagni]
MIAFRSLLVAHGLRKIEKRIILGMQRRKPRKHFAELPGIGVAGQGLQGFTAHAPDAMSMGCDFRHRHSPSDHIIFWMT